MSYLYIDKNFKADEKELAEKAINFSESYNQAKPFNHIKIDNFINENILNEFINDFLSTKKTASQKFNNNQEKLKNLYSPHKLSNFSYNFFNFFNSTTFINFLENLTKIKGLIPDPYFLGGGMHETFNGGHLDIHADFNLHPIMNLERRINVLIYLNKDWKKSYGGQFELWDKDMKKISKEFDPIYNRCIIFNTSSSSYHGNPNPVNHPNNSSRLSIALYYYTASWSKLKKSHSTKFKIRPNSPDKANRLENIKDIIVDFIPPIIIRGIKRLIQYINMN